MAVSQGVSVVGKTSPRMIPVQQRSRKARWGQLARLGFATIGAGSSLAAETNSEVSCLGMNPIVLRILKFYFRILNTTLRGFEGAVGRCRVLPMGGFRQRRARMLAHDISVRHTITLEICITIAYNNV
jgi:hypothetical protein